MPEPKYLLDYFDVATGGATAHTTPLPPSGTLQAVSCNSTGGTAAPEMLQKTLLLADVTLTPNMFILLNTGYSEVAWHGAISLRPNLSIRTSILNDSGSTVSFRLHAVVQP